MVPARKPSYPTRWCSQCEIDWPQHTTFNLCPKCGRNTTAETSDTKPDETAARVLAGKYRAFAEYEEKFWASLEQAFHAAPTIPDPPPVKRRQYPLPETFHGGKPPMDEDVRDWTDDATPDAT